MIDFENIVTDLENCETEYGFNPQDIWDILDKMKYQQGSCAECKHYAVSGRGEKWNRCLRTMDTREMEPDDGCIKYFERRGS